MKSFLLSELREVGNSVRYGDAKCVVIAGASFTLLISYFRYLFGEQGNTWEIVASQEFGNLPIQDTLIVSLLTASFMLSSLALIPSVSKRSLRISSVNWINRMFRRDGVGPGEYGIVYFRDIAMHHSVEAYGRSLTRKFEVENSLDDVESDLATQIWIVSRIATTKFLIASFSIYFLFIAVSLFFFMFIF
ncbi:MULTISPECIES: Pycsar system effector family protein [Alphaproteobacteria]|uniref:Pycsar system effector family protein n=1 Tax=Alphaproteobacteria TaxID=28211 RepID=UPI0032660187